MDRVEKFAKNRLDKITSVYLCAVFFAVYSIDIGDIDGVKTAHNYLVSLFEKAKKIINRTCSESVYKLIETDELKNLPDFLNSFKLIETYRKMASSFFINLEFGDERDILLNKMGIYLNEKSELPYLYIAQVLNKLKKYPESVRMVQFFDSLSNSTPVMEFLTELFNNTKRYDKVIDAYVQLLKMWQRNDTLKSKLNKICCEVMAGNE